MLPAVRLQFSLHTPFHRRDSGVQPQFVGSARHPGSAWPRFWDRPHPCMLSPCSNGILYQYPDRTDVIPLLSVNMG